MDDKSDWECIVDKVKVLNRLSPDGPIPLEIFSPETKFIKQGRGYGYLPLIFFILLYVRPCDYQGERERKGSPQDLFLVHDSHCFS